MLFLAPGGILLWLGTGPLQPSVLASSSQAPTPAGRVARAVRVDQPPTLDGVLDEPSWQQAPVTGGFLQRDPRQGEAASEATEVRILYNETSLYLGVVCHDSQPQRIRATERARDADLESDDRFEVILDTLYRLRFLGQ